MARGSATAGIRSQFAARALSRALAQQGERARWEWHPALPHGLVCTMAPESGRRGRLRITLLLACTALCLCLAGLVAYRAWRASQELRLAERARHQGAGAPDHNLPFVGLPECNLNNAGVQYAARGDYDAAIREFQRAVQHKPDYLPGHKNLLAAYIQTGDWREALDAAQKAEQLHPLVHLLRRTEIPGDEEALAALREDRDFVVNLGLAYLKNDDLGTASARLTLGLRLAPLDLRARNGLAEVHFRCRDYDEALRLWAESLKSYAKQPKVVERLQEIARERPDLAARIEWTIATYVTAKTTVPGMDLPGPPSSVPGVPEPHALHPAASVPPGPTRPNADDPMVPLPRAPDPRATVPRP
jgi:tetratricopeptide (TPR) repeat protein